MSYQPSFEDFLNHLIEFNAEDMLISTVDMTTDWETASDTQN